MATMFEPSLSTSAMRPHLSADAPSTADSLPSINFGFEDLRERMARFSERFDEFIARGRKQVLEERNQFRISVAELQDAQRVKHRDLEILAQKSVSHSASVKAQDSETAEMHTAIASLTRDRDTRLSHRDHLLSSIAATKQSIDQRVAAQQTYSKGIEAQQRHNIPELEFWETYLGLRIEGAGMADRLKFVFTGCDERDGEREAWFELDTQRRDYQLGIVRPKLEAGDTESCLERLNENRDLGPFLKGMRDLFVKAMKA